MFILTKLPSDVRRTPFLFGLFDLSCSVQIGLEIPYAPAFNSAAVPEAHRSLVFDRAGVLFNIAALYSQLAASEDRSTPHGLKQAIKFCQVNMPLITKLRAESYSQPCTELSGDPELSILNCRFFAADITGARRAPFKPRRAVPPKFRTTDARPGSGMCLAEGRNGRALP